MEGFFTNFQLAFTSTAISRTVFLVLTTLAVVVFIMASQLLVRGANDPVRRRLNELVGKKEESAGWYMHRWVQATHDFVLPKNDSEKRKIHALLMQAGWYSEGAVWLFYGSKLLITVLLPLLIIPVLAFGEVDLSFQGWLFALLAAAVIGVLLPNWYLKRAIAERHRLISNAIPDTLDLLILCLEVGLGLRSALRRVSSDLFISHPALSYELELVTAELKAGLATEKALENLGRRVNLKELDGLVSTMVDSIRFGTSIADTLRAFSADLRDKRIQSAEEQAEKISTKMIFPVVLLLLPAFFIIAVGPAIIRLLDALTHL